MSRQTKPRDTELTALLAKEKLQNPNKNPWKEKRRELSLLRASLQADEEDKPKEMGEEADDSKNDHGGSHETLGTTNKPHWQNRLQPGSFSCLAKHKLPPNLDLMVLNCILSAKLQLLRSLGSPQPMGVSH